MEGRRRRQELARSDSGSVDVHEGSEGGLSLAQTHARQQRRMAARSFFGNVRDEPSRGAHFREDAPLLVRL